MGRLRARGMLKLAQFWPEGRSDADTANLTITLELDPAFVYRPDKGVEKATKVFHEAQWNDEGDLKPVLGAKRNKLRVRLQGIDAPELHYLPRVKGAKQFRQRLAESSVFSLRKMLLEMAVGAKELRADAITFVNSPNDAFDIYGRYVGNVTVYADGFAVDINHWLLEHGWAVPGLYNSMTDREISVSRTLSSAAAEQKLGVYKSAYYKDKVVKFEPDLLERRHVDPNRFRLYEDRGPVMNPKFFRRQASYEANERLKPSGLSFRDWLTGQKKFRGVTWKKFQALPLAVKRDADKLKKHTELLGDLVGKKGALPKADDLIYVEEAADIVDPDGRVIDQWDFEN